MPWAKELAPDINGNYRRRIIQIGHGHGSIIISAAFLFSSYGKAIGQYDSIVEGLALILIHIGYSSFGMDFHGGAAPASAGRMSRLLSPTG